MWYFIRPSIWNARPTEALAYMVLYFILVSLLVMLYCVWRWRRWSQAITTYEPLFPPAKQLCWTRPVAIPKQGNIVLSRTAEEMEAPGSIPVEVEARTPDGRFERPVILREVAAAGLAAGIDGAFVGISTLEAFRHIDIDFVHAIEFSTAEHLTGLHSIDSYVEAHFFDAATISAEGWLHRLEGYVAEQKAAAALEKGHHIVQFALTANQQSWDLLVDGHPWQVKEGIDIRGIKDALAHHGDIPIATGADLAGQVNSPLVHGFHALDHDAIVVGTKEALEGVKDAFHPGLKIPIVTVVLSSWREFKLLMEDKTTLDRALKSVAIDAAGVGVGMATGAKLGALLFSWATPVGAGIGALVFSVGGAILGRMGSHAYRFKDFNLAYDTYQAVHVEAERAVYQSVEASRGDVQRLARTHEEKYLTARSDIEAGLNRGFESIRATRDAELDTFAARFPEDLENLLKQLEAEEQTVLGSKPKARWWGFLFPGGIELERDVIRRWFQHARERVVQEQHAYRLLWDRQTRLTEIRRFLTEYEFELRSLRQNLDCLAEKLNKLQADGECLQAHAIQEATTARDQLIRGLGERVAAIRNTVAETITSWSARLKRSRASLCREAEPLGVKLPS